MADKRTGILCMAYGSPADEAGIEPYFTHIRGGRPPSGEALEELTGRYRAIGGSPLSEITRAQARALEAQLGLPVFVGFKHAPPFIAEGAEAARQAGVDRLVGLPLAPHYARMSLGGYQRALAEAWRGELVFVPGFHDHPAFIRAVKAILAEALAEFAPERLFFTAHSLPERIIAEGDGYYDQLLATCRLVEEGMALPPWEFAFQSASRTGEPWLGPDLLEALEKSGAKRALVCPIGFVADHLEVLYDLDREALDFARARGIELRRTASFNSRPEFVTALAEIVLDALREPSSNPAWWRPGDPPPPAARPQPVTPAAPATAAPPVPPAQTVHLERPQLAAPPAPASGIQPTTVGGGFKAPPRTAVVSIRSGPDTGRRFALDTSPLYVGRAPDNGVVVSDPTTSRRHARFENREGEFLVVDLGGSNGTLVDGARVVERVLVTGSVVTMGQNDFEVTIS